jgi:hypothetical protein
MDPKEQDKPDPCRGQSSGCCAYPPEFYIWYGTSGCTTVALTLAKLAELAAKKSA